MTGIPADIRRGIRSPFFQHTERLADLVDAHTLSPIGWQLLLQGVCTLGYMEGQHFVIEERYAEGRFERLPELAAQHRLPAVYLHWDHVEAGELMDYTPDDQHLFRRALSMWTGF